MPNTFELRNQYLNWLEAIENDNGEISPENETALFEWIQSVEDKGEAIYFMIRKCEASIDECKTLEDDFKAQRRKWENRKKKIQGYLTTLLLLKGETEEKPKFKGPWGSAYLSRRKTVQIIDEESVLKSFGIEETIRKIDRDALKKHLEQSDDFEGARMIEIVSSSIRSR